MAEETSASSIYYLQLRVDRFIIDFVLNLIINILIAFGCRLAIFQIPTQQQVVNSRIFFSLNFDYPKGLDIFIFRYHNESNSPIMNQKIPCICNLYPNYAI
jgi:hypothetical protein